MANILDDLVQQIKKSEGTARPASKGARVNSPPAQRRRRGIVKAVGSGGIIFDFGPSTGNPMADRFSALLNHHSDPLQAQIVKDQLRDQQKSLGEFVALGEGEFQRKHNTGGGSDIAQKAWNQQFSGSVDETIKKLHAEGKLEVENPTAIEKGTGARAYGDSSIKLESGENVQATSETDQAVIEMMKSAQLNDIEE